MKLGILDNLKCYLMNKFRQAFTTDIDDNIAIRVEPSDTTKVTTEQLMCVLVGVYEQLQIMNAHLK